jgi:putative ubiquitin-RnfH superfamily antitoxin RatB of RatAB toxin-antitoxin module
MGPDSAATAATAVGAVKVEVCYSPAPGVVDRCELLLPAGSTLWQAVQASGLLQRHPELAGHAADGLNAGIWGRRQPADAVLRNRDRVELYRPLKVDPKEARRQRYRGQGESGRRKLGA